MSRSASSWVFALSVVLATAGLFELISDHVSIDPRLAYVLAFACVAGASLLTTRYAPVISARATAIATVLGGVIVLGSRVLPAGGLAQAACVMTGLYLAGAAVGGLVGRRIESAGHLVFVALVSSIADIASVTAPAGATAIITANAQALSMLAVSWPMLATGEIAPILGVGDIVFTALYLGAGSRHQLDERRSLLALGAGYMATLAAVLGLERAVPALPLLGLAFVLVHPQARQVPESDRRRGWAGAIAISVLLAALAAYRP